MAHINESEKQKEEMGYTNFQKTGSVTKEPLTNSEKP